MDYILIFCNGDRGEVGFLKNVLNLFGKASHMLINYQIYSLIVTNLDVDVV